MFDDKRFKIIVSIILGLGIASLFKVTCEGRNCIILREGPDREFVENNNYKFGEKCYKFNSENTKC